MCSEWGALKWLESTLTLEGGAVSKGYEESHTPTHESFGFRIRLLVPYYIAPYGLSLVRVCLYLAYAPPPILNATSAVVTQPPPQVGGRVWE